MDKGKSGVLQRIKYLLNTSQWHDLEFHVRDDRTGEIKIFGAHRVIIAPCSPVFEALCFGSLAEKEPVFVTDIEPDAFKALLQYLYTDTLVFNSIELGMNLLYASNKYMIPDLKSLAVKYLSENISDSNCVDLHNLASAVDEESLVTSTFDHICRRLEYVKKYVENDAIGLDLIFKLVTSKILSCKEITLVYLAQMWARKECELLGIEISSINTKRLLLQNKIFQHIQWDVLSDDDLQQVMPGLLSQEEISRRTLRPVSQRNQCPIKYAYLHRYASENVFVPNIAEGLTVRAKVSVNRSVTLRGLFISAKSTPILLQNYNVPQSYKERMELTIFRGDNNDEELLTQKVSEDVKYGDSFYVRLDRPMPFIENEGYEVRVGLLNPVQDYTFGRLNNKLKIPSGLVVTIVETAETHGFEPRFFGRESGISLITGFEFMY